MSGYPELTDEQVALRNAVREFAQAEIVPHAGEWDRCSLFPENAIRQLGELGVMGLPFPEEYGGLGSGSLSFVLALEEIARADSSVAITVSASVGLAGGVLLAFGSDEQKRTWLTPIAQGKALGAFANTEAEAGSDVQGIRTSAQLEGGEWVLNGSKAYITNAGTSMTNCVITTVATGRKPDGHPELSTIIVPSGTPGLDPQRPYHKMGWHASDTREVVYSDCRVPESMLLGQRGAGARQFLTTVDGGRIGVAALALGLADTCLELSLEWAKHRRAFGQVIGSFQGVAFQLAELEAEIEAARGLVYGAAAARDKGKSHVLEAARAKLVASEVAVKAADLAMQVHGGYGYMEETPLPRLYRDAKILTIGEGSSEILKLVIARELGLNV